MAINRLTPVSEGLDALEVTSAQMAERVRRIRETLSAEELRDMFVRRLEDELFFSIGYFLLTPDERRGAAARNDAVFRGYLALRYLDVDGPGDRSPYERYSKDPSGEIDRFTAEFRRLFRMRLCHRCHEMRSVTEFRGSRQPQTCKRCLRSL